MAIALVNTNTNSGSSSAPSVTLPAGSVGDALIVVINHNDGTLTNSDNNGATPLAKDLEFGTINPDAGGGGQTIFSRILTGSEPSTLNFTQTGSNRWAITAFILSGVDSTIYDVAPPSASTKALPGTTVNSASVTTLTDGAWAIACAIIDDATGAWDSGASGSYTQLSIVNAQEPQKIMYQAVATAGASGACTFTPTFSTNIAALGQFAIKPTTAVASIKKLISFGMIPFSR